MPNYKVQMKQGSSTVVNYYEAKSVNELLTFRQSITTMRVSEILKVEYSDDEKPPIDDFNYCSLYKGYVRSANNLSSQIVIQNVKKTVNEKKIAELCKLHLELKGAKIGSIHSSLFKKDK